MHRRRHRRPPVVFRIRRFQAPFAVFCRCRPFGNRFLDVRLSFAADLFPGVTQLATVGEDCFMNVWELPKCGQGGPSGQASH